MLFCTSLIALVGAADQPQSSSRKLQIVNTKVGGIFVLMRTGHAHESLGASVSWVVATSWSRWALQLAQPKNL